MHLPRTKYYWTQWDNIWETFSGLHWVFYFSQNCATYQEHKKTPTRIRITAGFSLWNIIVPAPLCGGQKTEGISAAHLQQFYSNLMVLISSNEIWEIYNVAKTLTILLEISGSHYLCTFSFIWFITWSTPWVWSLLQPLFSACPVCRSAATKKKVRLLKKGCRVDWLIS